MILDGHLNVTDLDKYDLIVKDVLPSDSNGQFIIDNNSLHCFFEHQLNENIDNQTPSDLYVNVMQSVDQFFLSQDDFDALMRPFFKWVDNDHLEIYTYDEVLKVFQDKDLSADFLTAKVNLITDIGCIVYNLMTLYYKCVKDTLDVNEVMIDFNDIFSWVFTEVELIKLSTLSYQWLNLDFLKDLTSLSYELKHIKTINIKSTLAIIFSSLVLFALYYGVSLNDALLLYCDIKEGGIE